VDDEALARRVVRDQLAGHPDIEVVGECANGFEAVKAAAETKPDLVFLDIQMPKLDGFEVLELLDQPVEVIFITAFDEHALRAFSVHAVDYLLKPFSPERFAEALDRARERMGRKGEHPDRRTDPPREADRDQAPSPPGVGPHTRAHDPGAARGGRAHDRGATRGARAPMAAEHPAARSLAAAARPPGTWLARVLVKDGAKVTVLPVGTIDSIEAQDDYIELRCGGRRHLKQQTLAEIEKDLDPARFVRIHRSYILNIERIARIEPYAKDSRVAVLADGTRLPVSRAGYQRLRELL
jgi:two-component system LytT family response regulator